MSNMTPQQLRRGIRSVTGFKAKGGERFDSIIEGFRIDGGSRLFIPWAAPADGREAVGSPEKDTVGWLGEELPQIFGSIGRITTRVMFADRYAEMNGFDMELANRYYDQVRELWQNLVSQSGITLEFTRASQVIEGEPDLDLGRDKLNDLKPELREKILKAARKYGGEVDGETAAARYCAMRFTEAQSVADEGQLWVSLNWPERDAMTGDAPRMYVPGGARTPWSKS